MINEIDLALSNSLKDYNNLLDYSNNQLIKYLGIPTYLVGNSPNDDKNIKHTLNYNIMNWFKKLFKKDTKSEVKNLYLIRYIKDGVLEKEYKWNTFAINESMASDEFFLLFDGSIHDILDIKIIK